jgi:phosphoadenosine phosphosulfate reductase
MSAEASSSTSSAGDILKTQYTPEQISAFNKELESKTPQEILVWAIDNLEGLYQTTAFGL